MRTTDRRRNPEQLSTTLVCAVAGALAIILIISVSLRLAAALSPRTGDMITFWPVPGGAVTTEASLHVARADHSPPAFCTLDPGVMRQSGGSVVVEAVASDRTRSYRVHWAGGRTSDSGKDCGEAAELLLAPNELEVLMFAASAPAETSDARYNRPGMGRRTR